MNEKTVAKLAFARHLRQVADSGENGAFTVVTDSGRSVLLRLSAGGITSSHCRSRDIEAAIAALAPSEAVRYTFTRLTPENKPELIGIDDFLRRIDAYVAPGATPAVQHADTRGPAPPTAAAPSRAGVPGRGTSIREDLEALAVDVIGPVAQVLVEEALANSDTVHGAIEMIARAIPNGEVGNRFRAAARDRFPDVERDS
jgi:hypothetical protein